MRISDWSSDVCSSDLLALANGQIEVANQDSLVRFAYSDGQTQASVPPVNVTYLPSEINHHWTKALAASPDGGVLYVGIGSNSNITERGMAAEADRAVIWEVDARTGAHRPYATGLRNPTAMAIQPDRSEEHTSELQSLMRISYAVFCLQKQ